MPGPVPKRSDQRRRRNKDNSPTKVTVATSAVKPPAENRAWHIAAKRWYRSLRHSGQSAFYEPSDWAYAQLAADILSDELSREKPRAATINQVLSMMDNLLTSEGARRRLRLELVRTDGTENETNNVVEMNPAVIYG
ncbi:hypothetical protein KRX51_03165 [Corynebacterium sp. TAE3-ERU12]|uniref:phage terminase small subunit n=1 Tax=Corynebacterium sp. TAE3-ERU12 TaxID=2849491 RepID=UPI001C47D329|nr:hypothetical protein [Corynebacterium sp. TAE3-ERU12]MBV7294918.1 hypothetical protein [Corynebacterium sp. TAE3-ERU12]